MAKKPAKKMATKSVAKKTTVKPAPVMEHKCGCGADCPCHCHGSAHWVKHIIVWAIIFALGMACGKMMDCGHHKKMMHRKMMHPVFTNGCLDVASIKCPKMAEEIVKADIDGNDCISVEEYKAWKKSNKPHMPEGVKGTCDGGCGMKK